MILIGTYFQFVDIHDKLTFIFKHFSNLGLWLMISDFVKKCSPEAVLDPQSNAFLKSVERNFPTTKKSGVNENN